MTAYKDDVYRYYGKEKESLRQWLFRPKQLNYICLLRKYQKCNTKLGKFWYKVRLWILSQKTQILVQRELPLGKGFYIGHLGRVLINEKAVLGDNVNVATGVTIGQTNRGERKGCPQIGNCVWIGTNAVVVGKIKIGDDVLIAPASYVNFDVPSHSIVIGNPGKIIPRENATEGYINNRV